MIVDFYKTKWSNLVAPKYRIKVVRVCRGLWLVVIDLGRHTWQWRLAR